MQRSRSALVVAATPGLSAHLVAWLKLAGWVITTADSYAAAKSRLELGADLLVTELELGDYNGLQLALRAQNSGVPAVVVGHEDTVLERDAEQLGSVYLRKAELDEHRLLVAIEARLASLANTLPAICRNVEFARRPWAVKPSSSTRRLLLH
jgi:DNA-binding response OmpR family regulator